MDDKSMIRLPGSNDHDLAGSLADNKNPILQEAHEDLSESFPRSSSPSDSDGTELLPGGDQTLIDSETLSKDSPWRLCPVCSTLPTEAFLLVNQTSSNLDFRFSAEDCVVIRKWVNKSPGDACGLSRLVLELESFWNASDVTTDSLITDYWKGKSTCRMYPRTRQIWDTGFLVSAEFDTVVRQTLDSYVVFPDMFLDSSLAQVRDWITDCDNGHRNCAHHSSLLPTRVLYVRDIDAIRLREISEEKGTYPALGHCWGLMNTFITTSSTIDSMKSGFHIKELPQTFRDAIIVTRALGHRYL